MVLTLFAAVLPGLPAAPQQPEKLERSTDAMGATFSIVLYGSDRASMNQAIDAAFEEVHRLDASALELPARERVESYQS